MLSITSILSRDLRAADHRDERPLRIAERHAEVAQLFLHQQARRRRELETCGNDCRRPTRARDARRRTRR